MGGAYSKEEELDFEAARYIQEQTREDLMRLQDPAYCNEVLGVVAKILGAVAWPAEFSFKGRVFNPNERSFALMARYYVQVAQMFGAGVRASLPPQLSPLANAAIDPLGTHLSAQVYLARLAERQRLLDKNIRVDFPQLGEMPAAILNIKEQLEKLKEITTEINYRAEVLDARLRFDYLTQRIEFLESL